MILKQNDDCLNLFSENKTYDCLRVEEANFRVALVTFSNESMSCAWLGFCEVDGDRFRLLSICGKLVDSRRHVKHVTIKINK